MPEADIIKRLEEILSLKEKYYNVKMAALELHSWLVFDPNVKAQEKGKVLTLYRKRTPSNLKAKL